jgi:hypothetical protein
MMMLWIILSLIVLLLLVFLVGLSLNKGKKMPPTDYYTFFIMGLIWLAVGIPFMFSDSGSFFFIMGLVFIAIGLVHKDEWKKNHKANMWKNLTKDQKRMKGLLIWTLIGLLILGLLFFIISWLPFSFRI